MNGRKWVENVVQMCDNRSLPSARHGVRCAVWLRCVNGCMGAVVVRGASVAVVVCAV